MSASTLAVLLLLGSAAVLGQPQSTPRIVLTSGSVWVDSPELGYVTLIDGPSEQVVATVVAGAKGSGRHVAQLGMSAVVASDDSGEVALIDGATFKTTTSKSFARPGSTLSVLASGSTAFVVDAASRTAIGLDVSAGLTPGRRLALDAQPGPAQVVVDDSGRLWAVDADGRGLIWVDPDDAVGSADADGAARLIPAGSGIALADLTTAHPGIGWLAADGSREPWSCVPPTRPTDNVQVLGDRDADRAFVAVDQTGTLTTVTAGEAGCRRSAQVTDTGHRLGPLVQSGEFVFVPDRTTGHTVVVDTTESAVVADIPLTEPENELELLARDGIVFYNDLDSERAGVIRLDEAGQWVAGNSLRKYDPVTKRPENPVHSSGTDASPVPTTSNASVPVPTTTTTTLDSSSPNSTSRPPESTRPTFSPESRTVGPTAPIAPPDTTTVEPPVEVPVIPEPPLVPVIVDITATPNPLVPGQDVTFQATVNDPSGAWRWSAAVFDTDIDQGDSPGSFTVTVPAQAEAVQVALQVGSSEPFFRTFPVNQPTVGTTVTITAAAPPEGSGYWTTDTVSVTVDVDNVGQGGLVPTGTVTLSATTSAPGQPVTGGEQQMELVDGRATFTGISTPAQGELSFRVSYAGDSTHHPSSSGSWIWINAAPKFLGWGICNGSFGMEVETENGPDSVENSVQWFDSPARQRVIGGGGFTFRMQLAPNQWEYAYTGPRWDGPEAWVFTITVKDVNTDRVQTFSFDDVSSGGCVATTSTPSLPPPPGG